MSFAWATKVDAERFGLTVTCAMELAPVTETTWPVMLTRSFTFTTFPSWLNAAIMPPDQASGNRRWLPVLLHSLLAARPAPRPVLRRLGALLAELRGPTHVRGRLRASK